MSLDRWVALDLSCDPEPVTDLVPRVLTPGWITLFNGASAAGKSFAYQGLVAAALTGAEWLGMHVEGIERILVIDEEHPPGVVRQRLQSFGVGPEHADRIHYYSQIGCRLGEARWGEDLLEVVADFKPQLVVVDSASSATAVAMNENDSIAQVFSTVLRPLARLGVAVLFLHHDRKSGGEVSERVLGGVQWLGQVDRQIAFQAQADSADSWTTATGTLRASFPFGMTAGKSRQGVGISDTRVSIESEMNGDDYMWIRLDVGETVPNATQEFADQVLAAIVEMGGRVRQGDLADKLEVQRNNGSLKRSLELLQRRGAVTKPERGVYECVSP